MDDLGAPAARAIGIAEMAAVSGLSQDTLRWYEKEGMLPRVARDSEGRRRYCESDQKLVALLATLRATGMPTSLMKEFVTLLAEGAASHGRRIEVLRESRLILEERQRQCAQALRALDAKVAHYQELIDAGLDCDLAPVSDEIREQQRSTTRLEMESA